MAIYSGALDANTLVPISLADTLLRLADAGLFRPLWTTKILEEVHQTLVSKLGIDTNKAHRRIARMSAAFEDATILGWQDLKHVLKPASLNDPDDWHVIAAAIAGRADAIVTWNTRDFPAELLSRWNIELQTPDTFLCNQLDLAPELTMRSLQKQANCLGNPPINVRDLITKIPAPQFQAAALTQLWRLAPSS